MKGSGTEKMKPCQLEPMSLDPAVGWIIVSKKQNWTPKWKSIFVQASDMAEKPLPVRPEDGGAWIQTLWVTSRFTGRLPLTADTRPVSPRDQGRGGSVPTALAPSCPGSRLLAGRRSWKGPPGPRRHLLMQVSDTDTA